MKTEDRRQKTENRGQRTEDREQKIKVCLLSSVFCLLFIGCAAKVTRPLPEISTPKAVYEEGSLWPKEESKLLLFKDTKANKVGDIVTVIIAESSQASKASQTKTSSASDNTLGFKAGTGIPTDFQFKGGNQFEGVGSTTRAGNLNASLTAVVVDVLSNGNLKIDGVKDIKVNDETQHRTVSGIVRPEDISRNNTVSSVDIADA
ncbi:MAG: flagellar basal body L-ring protein FlgH [Nitrospinae bacterium]|nr:flagellar basal body L-ring protein FlgH [Nitrospinota bacterium]